MHFYIIYPKKTSGTSFFRLMGYFVLLMVLILIIGPGDPAMAQGDKISTQGRAQVKPPNLSALLSDNEMAWLEELEKMRGEPEQSREKLSAALQAGFDGKNRWRVFHHLIEFGEEEEIPYLLDNLKKEESEKSIKAILGAIYALYRPGKTRDDLKMVIREFSFVQTAPVEEKNVQFNGKFHISRSVINDLHRERFPQLVIDRIIALQGRAFDTQEALIKVVESQLKMDGQEAYAEKIAALIEPVPNLIEQTGMVRIKLENRFQNPLLFRLHIDAWYGRFEQQPSEELVFLEPEKPITLDFPVKLIKSSKVNGMRIDLRMREVNGPFLPLDQKLYVVH